MIDYARQFLSDAGDVQTGAMGEAAPAVLQDNRVEALIDGDAYFAAIDAEIDELLDNPFGANKYFYMTAWVLSLIDCNGPVTIRPSSGSTSWLLDVIPGVSADWTHNVKATQFTLPRSGKPLLQRLADLVKSGVDVRVLAWTSRFLPRLKDLAAQMPQQASWGLETIMSVAYLRKHLGERAVLNTVAHPLGSAHLKMVVCGNDGRMCALTGGLDPKQDRLTAPHPGGGWHDVGVKVEGPAAAAMYHFFRQLWEEQRAQPVETFHVAGAPVASHSLETPPLPVRELANAQGGAAQVVQVLRTVPRMSFSMTGPEELPVNPVLRAVMNQAIGFKRPAISFAPDGIFEYKVALQKAISRAEQYVFIADQAFWSFEVMDWLNARLRKMPTLKIILLFGSDPDDPPTSFMNQALRCHLYHPMYMNQIAVYWWRGTVVHCKVAIVDDKWCAVGSANCTRRSLYTDVELALGIVDAGSDFVRRLRCQLWAEYCGLAPADAMALQGLAQALGIWRPKGGWGSAPRGIKLQDSIVPLPDSNQAFDEPLHRLLDTDSRDTF